MFNHTIVFYTRALPKAQALSRKNTSVGKIKQNLQNQLPERGRILFFLVPIHFYILAFSTSPSIQTAAANIITFRIYLYKL